jgi:hypothetical protein
MVNVSEWVAVLWNSVHIFLTHLILKVHSHKKKLQGFKSRKIADHENAPQTVQNISLARLSPWKHHK